MTTRTSMAAVVLAAAIATECPPPRKPARKLSQTPQDAARALIDAAASNDTAAMLLIFGPGGKDIVQSGDAAADKESRERFAALAGQKMQVGTGRGQGSRTLIVGPDDCPCRCRSFWRKANGASTPPWAALEVLARRVGRNELTAMDVCRAYVEAQMEYASRDRLAAAPCSTPRGS